MWPAVLQPPRGQDLDEVAHVQAGRGRVEADVEPHAPLGQGLAQGVEVRRVGDQAAPLEVVEESGVDGHAWAFRRVGVRRGQACRIARAVAHPVCLERARVVDSRYDSARTEEDALDRRQVHARPRDRARRHGCGLARPRRGARPRRRDQADRHGARRRVPRPRARRARGAGWRRGSTTRTSWRSSTWCTRATSAGWSWSTSPGVTLAELVRRDGALTPDQAAPMLAAGGRRAGRRPRGRDRAPRREAVEHPGHRRRPGEAVRLRHRPRRGGRLAHPDRPGHRLPRLPRARGRVRQLGHRRQRRLVARRDAVPRARRAARRTRWATT